MLLKTCTLTTFLLICLSFDLIKGNNEPPKFSKLLNQKSADLLKSSSIGNTKTTSKRLRNIFNNASPTPTPYTSSSFSISSFRHKILEDEPETPVPKKTMTAAEQVDGILTSLNQKPIEGRPTVTAQRSEGGKRININPVFPENRRRGKSENSSKETTSKEIATTTVLPQLSSSSKELSSGEELEVTTVQNFDVKRDSSSAETTTSEPLPTTTLPMTTTLVPERVTVFDNRTNLATTTTETNTLSPLLEDVHDTEEQENYLISETYHRQGHFPDFEDLPTNLATAESNQPARVNVRPAASGKDYEYEYIYYYYDDDEDSPNGTSTTVAEPKTEVLPGGKSSVEAEKGRNTLDAAKSLSSASQANVVQESKPIVLKQSNLPATPEPQPQNERPRPRFPQVPRSEFPQVPTTQSVTPKPTLLFPQHPKAGEISSTVQSQPEATQDFSPPILQFEFVPSPVPPTSSFVPTQQIKQETPSPRRFNSLRKPESEPQSRENLSRRPENEPQSRENLSRRPENEPQSRENLSRRPENESQSRENLSRRPENESQSRENLSRRPENESQSREIISRRPENEPQSREVISRRPENEPQSREVISRRPENEQQSREINNRRPENEHKSRETIRRPERPEPVSVSQEAPPVRHQPRLRNSNFRRTTTPQPIRPTQEILYEPQAPPQELEREVQQQTPIISEEIHLEEPEFQKINPESASPFIPISHPQPVDEFAHLQPVEPSPPPRNTIPAVPRDERPPTRTRFPGRGSTRPTASVPSTEIVEQFSPPLVPSRTPLDPIAEIPSPQLGTNSLESQESKARENYARQKSINDLYALSRLHQLAINTRIPNNRKQGESPVYKGTPPKNAAGFINSVEVTTLYPEDNILHSESTTISSFVPPSYVSSGDVKRIPTIPTSRPSTTEESSPSTEPERVGLRQRPRGFRGKNRPSTSTTTTSTESAPRTYNHNRFANRRRTSTTPQPQAEANQDVVQEDNSHAVAPPESEAPPAPTRASVVRNRFAGRTRPSTSTTTEPSSQEGIEGPSTEGTQPLRRRPGHFQGRRRTSTTPSPNETSEQKSDSQQSPEIIQEKKVTRPKGRPIVGRPLRGRASTTTTTTEASVPETESEVSQEQLPEQNPTVQVLSQEQPISQKVSVSTSTSESTEEVAVPKRGSAGVLGRLRNRAKALQQEQSASISSESGASESLSSPAKRPNKFKGLLSRRKLAESESKNSEQQVESGQSEKQETQEQINADPNIPIPTNLPKGVIVQVSSIVTESEETSEDQPPQVEASTQGSILNRLKSQRKPGSLFNRKRTSDS